MKFSPRVVWVALFALLACAADGPGFGALTPSITSVDVCAAQAHIASLSSPARQYAVVVCDLQRALGAVNGQGPAPASPELASLVVTLAASRTALHPPGGSAASTQGEITDSGTVYAPSIETIRAFPTPKGAPPGSRFSFQIAPHAPPRVA